MAKRGLAVEAVYYHSAPFTDTQVRITERSDPAEVTLLMRACMVRMAEMLAVRRDAVALVTGECLGQVAGQTPESMYFTGSFAQLPIFRPLVGMDKEEIIRLARRIGTCETSILPYEDCCRSLFSPAHPVVKPTLLSLPPAPPTETE